MFKKLLSSIGIGAATVDTRLAENSCVPGGTLDGVVHIKGGNVEQSVDRIYIFFNTLYKHEVNDKTTYSTFTIEKILLNEAPFMIGPDEVKEIPFTIEVPFNTPISVSQSKTWIETGLDIAQAVDPKDEDSILVKPNRQQQVILDVLDDIGFRLKKADTEMLPARQRSGRLPIAQELEYSPNGTSFGRRLDELEVILLQDETNLDLLIQVDKSVHSLGSLFADLTGTDESTHRLSYSQADLSSPERIRRDIESLIERSI
ncbi:MULTISPECIES: sporulation protein [unclassified Exiguobacterium]|uniref:sporulation protein n=1 Tax=unclassified Exiguobacterium TaxID=2644629 RepID=UPI00103A6BA3|nr:MULTISPECIES: sporulation protein [unclassified Exiguobacterium]TCI25226.1 sporulation protein [Exiguobacterium sp. SH5S4]TCI62776.1 sporulation protein [Exiguobacterium sp. SH3S1]